MSGARLRSLLGETAWGVLLVTFDFNVGTLDILPDFVGWFLLAHAVKELAPELPQLPLLYPLAAALGVAAVPEALLQLLGEDLWAALPGALSSAAALILAVIRIYFFFQLFTDLAGLAARLQPEGRRLDRAMRWQRNARTALDTLVSLPVIYPALSALGDHPAAVAALIVYVWGLLFWALWCLLSLRALVPGEEAPAAPDAP